MLKTISLFTLCILAAGVLSCASKSPKVTPAMPPVQHELWDALLQKYVRADGFVDYAGFALDSVQLNQYLRILASAHPQPNWPKAQQMAYWINAYNAFTVKLILDHYPVSSIKDIKRGIPFVNSVWDIKFIRLQGKEYTLNDIEHRILRPKFKDARIHAAINCASFSCPRLRTEAYTADKLENQLDDAMRTFINDPLRNRIRADKGELSSIFSWFGGDFKRDAGSVRAFVNRYANTPIGSKAKMSFMTYDWRLNAADQSFID